MKNGKFKTALQFTGVPLALFCGGMALTGLSWLINPLYELNTPGFLIVAMTFIAALVLGLLGMFLLRNVPKRRLVVSSAIACGLVLIFQLASVLLVSPRDPFGVGTALLHLAYRIFGPFAVIPFRLLNWAATGIMNAMSDGAGNYGAGAKCASVIFTVIETLLPMLYSFSGAFNRLFDEKKTEE